MTNAAQRTRIRRITAELNAQLNTIKEQSDDIARQARELEQQLNVARGTRDIPNTEIPSLKQAEAEHPTGHTRAELYQRLEAMLRERPMRYREILEAIGDPNDTRSRTKSILVQMQRDDIGLVNLGDDAKALWFIPDQRVLQRLQQVKPKR